MGAQARGSAVAVVLLVALLVSGSRAAQYTVGGAKEWNLQADYATWAAGNKFKTGDSLLFKYSAEEHNVLQVSAADYQSCNLGNAIKTWDDGNTVVTLPEATTYYFVCGIPSHCTSGMKVEVSVLASTAAPPSSATPPSAVPPPVTPPPVATPPAVPPPVTPPPVATPPVVPPPVTPPPVATPPPVSPPAPLSSPPSSSAPAPPPSPATASSPTPSPSPTPSSSAAPSPTATPVSSPSAPPTSTPLSPSSSSTEPAAAPGSSNAHTSLTAQAVTTIAAAALVGALLL